MKTKLIIILFTIIVLFTSCGIVFEDQQIVYTIVQEQCMEPMFTSAFPIGDEAFSVLATMRPMEKGQSPTIWKKISEFPPSDGELLDIFFSLDKDGAQLLWLTVRTQYEVRVWRFDIIDNKWLLGPSVSKNAKLFSDTQGNVWVIEPLYEKPSSLYKINLDTLDIVSEDRRNPLFANHTILGIDSTPDGKIWLILSAPEDEQGLFEYSTASSELVQHLVPDDYVNLEIDNNGVLYLLLYDGRIIRYNPENGDSEENQINLTNGSLRMVKTGLLATNKNVLWVSDVSNFRISDDRLTTQHVIVRSPVFITNIFNGYSPFIWDRPEPQADTKDGRIWFRSERGLAWHQPETGEWCMFTSAQSNIVKDSQENLWIVYDNALYMLPASETSKKE